ncbi:DUF2384 domain-containing protein [Alginatibacterium sediminis]|uniref:DUF2384 domain-containing protein n=1 Tax=Alginatibacterium sediminis TaxID=2164068 RepID=A0A420ENM5_9ALTE|nr:MbcA/ParS/Xre antitoxin family protein [Alginatibacterium sediminis]RKF22278.1 DUF2384 domain-containing protein [Alginatibacterium sediminis]
MTKEKVLAYAIEVFGSTQKAERWLTKAKKEFGGESPMAQLEKGNTNEVRKLLDRVANGYF